MLRIFLYIALALFVTWCSTSVKLGEHSCAGHVKRIWASDEGSDLREGVKAKATSEGTREVLEDVAETAAPVVDRVSRGVKAGFREAVAGDAGAKATHAAGEATERATRAASDAAAAAARTAAEKEVRRRTEAAAGGD